MADSSVTLYKLEHPTAKGSSITLSQARYAQAFGVTTYLAPQPSDGDSTPTKTSRDLLVIGCSKKVVVYGAGSRLGEAWEMSLQHTPRQVIFPAPVYADLPGAVHLLFSPHASVILNIKTGVPSNQRLSVIEPPSQGYPAPKGGVAKPAAQGEAGGWGVGRLGGFMRGTAMPVGTRTVGGEVVLVREGRLVRHRSQLTPDLGVFFSSEGNFTRDESLQWPAAPDALGELLHAGRADTSFRQPLPLLGRPSAGCSSWIPRSPPYYPSAPRAYAHIAAYRLFPSTSHWLSHRLRHQCRHYLDGGQEVLQDSSRLDSDRSQSLRRWEYDLGGPRDRYRRASGRTRQGG